MTYKSNKLKFITQGLMGPNIIFPAAYILFSAEMCSSFSNDKKRGHISGLSLSSLTNQVKQAHAIEGLNGSNALGVKALVGSGRLFNLGDYQCGVFVASGTEETFICKLSLENGWISPCKEGDGPGRVEVHYDAVADARMIKVDHALVELLGQQLGQSSDGWWDMAFFYKAPVGDSNIFTEDSITPATAFTKKIYKKLSNPIIGTGSLISSTLSITGKVASDTLVHGIKRGFVFVKDASSLVRLVKDILESGAEWGTTAAVVPTRDYIIVPASLVGGTLQADARDLDLQSQDAHASLRLEGYRSAYCCLNDGAYYRLIALDHVKSSVEIDKEQRYERFYTGITTPTVVPPEQPIPKNETITSPVATASQAKLALQEIQVTCENNDVLPPPLSNPLDQLGSFGSSPLNQAQKDKFVDGIDGPFTDQPQALALVQKVNLASVLPTPPPSPLRQTEEDLGGTILVDNNAVPPLPPPPLPITSNISKNNGSSLAQVTGDNNREQDVSNRDALLQQIRAGKQLKKVDQAPHTNGLKNEDAPIPPIFQAVRDLIVHVGSDSDNESGSESDSGWDESDN